MTTQLRPSLAVDEALAFAERAESLVEELNRLHEAADRSPSAIARTHQELGLCLKLAEVHATLAVADQLQALREALAR